MTTISILGSGTWGTALAKTLAEAGHDVRLWSISQDEIDALTSTHRHKNLPGAILPDTSNRKYHRQVQFSQMILSFIMHQLLLR